MPSESTIFNPASQDHVGRRCTWNVYGIQYTGVILRVVTEKTGISEPGDWFVKVDGGGHAQVIGAECKLIP